MVWEPILVSDWSRPTRPVLSRISDRRVMQFWDKGHEGVLWDLVAVYPRGVQWGGSQPVFVDGPVAKVDAALARQLAEVSQQ